MFFIKMNRQKMCIQRDTNEDETKLGIDQMFGHVLVIF